MTMSFQRTPSRKIAYQTQLDLSTAQMDLKSVIRLREFSRVLKATFRSTPTKH